MSTGFFHITVGNSSECTVFSTVITGPSSIRSGPAEVAVASVSEQELQRLRNYFHQPHDPKQDMEIAEGIQLAWKQLRSDGMLIKDFAEMLGIHHQVVRNYLWLNELPEVRKDKIRKGRMKMISALKWLNSQRG